MSEIRVGRVLSWLFSHRPLLQLHSDPHWRITVGLIALVTVMYYVGIDRFDTPLALFYFEVKHDVHGLAYLVPFLYATITLSIVGATASWILVFFGALPRIIYYSLGSNAELHNTLSLVVPFLVALTILLELRWREQHAQLAAERERQRKLQIEYVFRAQENERRRIAQGLHDDVLQRLMAIAVLAENLDGAGTRTSAGRTPMAAKIREESLRLAEELRRLSYDLRPSILDSLGLVSAVGWLSQRLQEESGMRVSLFTNGNVARLSPLIETNVFRIVQECFNNIRQHSRATESVTSLDFSPTRLVLGVSDNGIGFVPSRAMQHAAERGHLGLLGIGERVESIGGTLTVTSRPGEGTSLVVRIPLIGDNSDSPS